MKLTEKNTLFLIFLIATLSGIIWPFTHWSVYVIGECLCYLILGYHIVSILKANIAWGFLLLTYNIIFVTHLSDAMVRIDAVVWFFLFLYFNRFIRTIGGAGASFFMCWISFFNVLRSFGVGDIYDWSPEVFISAIILYIYTVLKFPYTRQYDY